MAGVYERLTSGKKDAAAQGGGVSFVPEEEGVGVYAKIARENRNQGVYSRIQQERPSDPIYDQWKLERQLREEMERVRQERLQQQKEAAVKAGAPAMAMQPVVTAAQVAVEQARKNQEAAKGYTAEQERAAKSMWKGAQRDIHAAISSGNLEALEGLAKRSAEKRELLDTVREGRTEAANRQAAPERYDNAVTLKGTALQESYNAEAMAKGAKAAGNPLVDFEGYVEDRRKATGQSPAAMFGVAWGADGKGTRAAEFLSTLSGKEREYIDYLYGTYDRQKAAQLLQAYLTNRANEQPALQPQVVDALQQAENAVQQAEKKTMGRNAGKVPVYIQSHLQDAQRGANINNNAGGVVAGMLSKPAYAVETVAQSVRNLAKGTDLTAPLYSEAALGVADSKAAEERFLKNFENKKLQWVAGVGLSIANSAANRLLGPIGKFMMGLQAMGGDAYDLAQEGEDATTILVHSALAGIAESAAESISWGRLDKILNGMPPKTFVGLLKTVGAQMTTEFGEEAVTESVNILTDWATRGENSTIAEVAAQAKEDGREHPGWYTAGVMAGQIALAGLAGAFSGGIMGGSAIALNAMRNKIGGNAAKANGQAVDLTQKAANAAGNDAAQVKPEELQNAVEPGKQGAEEAPKAAAGIRVEVPIMAVGDEKDAARMNAFIPGSAVVRGEENGKRTADTENADGKSREREKRELVAKFAEDKSLSAEEKVKRIDFYLNTERLSHKVNMDVTLDSGNIEPTMSEEEYRRLEAKDRMEILEELGRFNEYRNAGGSVEEYIKNGTQGDDTKVVEAAKPVVETQQSVGGNTQSVVADSSGAAENVQGVAKNTQNLEGAQEKEQRAAFRGRVDDSEIRGIKLTERQTADRKVYEALSSALGVQIRLTASKADEMGRRSGANGYYDRRTNSFVFDINAENFSELDRDAKGQLNTAAALTMSHELTHYIQRWSPEQYGVLKDTVMRILQEQTGQDVATIIDRKRQTLMQDGQAQMSDADVLDEIVADGCQMMLRDSGVFEQIAQKNRTLGQKIVDWLKSAVTALRKAYEGLTARSSEAKYIAQVAENYQRVLDQWTAALMDARDTSRNGPQTSAQSVTENQQNTAENQGVKTEVTKRDPRPAGYWAAKNIDNEEDAEPEGKEYAEDGVQIDSKTESAAPTDVVFSRRTWTESEWVQERERMAAKLAKDTGVTVKKAQRYLRNIDSVARLIANDRARLDYDPNIDEKATAVKDNSEYKKTLDFSTLCAKRLLFTGTFDAIQKQLPNRALTSEEIVELRKMMMDRGYQVACGICYVESTRREIGPVTQKFIEQYKKAQQTGEPIKTVNDKGEEKTLYPKDEKGKIDKTRPLYAEPGYTPTLADLNTTDIDVVKAQHPEVYEAYLAFMNARGQQKPKLLETRAEYKGEIAEFSKALVDSLVSHGGFRLQSFSDFEVPHLIDMMQAVLDMNKVGLTSQAYTKVPLFAEVFGRTGIKINLSLIAKGTGLDEQGRLIFDNVEGMPASEAFRLRAKYSKNVGTILVGKNDAHIEAAMKDPRIDYIIPFHKSSWNAELYDALGLTGYQDYTKGQNEKDAATGKTVKNYDPSEYWDPTKTGDENAQIYLEKCRREGRIPKFEKFAGKPGYWKLLIDFKMYDNKGNFSPQEKVKPDFNMAAARRILNSYEGGHQSFPVADDVVKDFVAKLTQKGFDETPKMQAAAPEYLSLSRRQPWQVDLKTGEWEATTKEPGRTAPSQKPGIQSSTSQVKPQGTGWEKFEDNRIAQAMHHKPEGAVANMGDAERVRHAEEEIRKAKNLLEGLKDPTRKGEIKIAEAVAEGSMTLRQVPEDFSRERVALMAEQMRLIKEWEKTGLQGQKKDIAVQQYKDSNEILDQSDDELFTGEGDQKARLVSTGALMRRTPMRALVKVFGDTTAANMAIDVLVRPTLANESAKIQAINRIFDRVRKLNVNKYESTMVQLVGEGLVPAWDEAKTNPLWHNGQQMVENLPLYARANPEIKELAAHLDRIDAKKVTKAVKELREMYNDYFSLVNEFRLAHGMPEIGHIKNYFPHFEGNMDGDLMNQALKAFGVEQMSNLPTGIAGLTANFKPKSRFVANFLQRRGPKTTFDAMAGFQMYTNAVMDMLYHTDDIMRLRYMESAVRERAKMQGEEGKRVSLSERLLEKAQDAKEREVMEQRLDSITENAELEKEYGGFVVWLREYANALAGKGSQFDRGVEGYGSRNLQNVLNKTMSRYSTALVVGNIKSALANVSVVPKTMAIMATEGKLLDPEKYASKALVAMASGQMRTVWHKSEFLSGKEGIDPLVKKGKDVYAEKAQTVFNVIERFMSRFVFATKYQQKMDEMAGLKITPEERENAAVQAANDFAAQIMSRRDKAGATLYSRSRSPIMKMLNMYQNEIWNSFYQNIDDIPNALKAVEKRYGKERARKAFANVATHYVVHSAILDGVCEAVLGFSIVPNPLEYLVELLLEFIDPDDEEDDEQSNMEAIVAVAADIAGHLPSVSAAMALAGYDSGRVPLPNVVDIGDDIAGIKKATTWQGKTAAVIDVLAGIGQFTGFPTAGQLAKTAKGVLSITEGGVRSRSTGQLQTVYKGGDGERLRAVFFGPSGTKGMQQYYENGYKAELTKKQTEAYDAKVKAGVPKDEALEYAKDIMPALTSSQLEAYDAAIGAGIHKDTALSYVKWSKGVTAKKDKDGETIPNSKRIQYLQQANEFESLTGEQRAILYQGALPSDQAKEFEEMTQKVDRLGVDMDTWMEFLERYYQIRGSGKKQRVRELMEDLELPPTTAQILGDIIGYDIR